MFVFSSVSNIEETLKNILIQDLNSKHPAIGQSIKVDTSSIIIKRDLEHTYHSESYVKEALNESMAMSNPKGSPPPAGIDKNLQTRVGVVRKTTVKPNQKKDPDEPDIDTENIPVVQGSFQITKTEADITENKKLSSSPIRHEDKGSHKPTSVKTTTTTKPPPTRTTPRTTTTKRVPTSTPKTRPFTITSTLNVKTRTEPTPKKDAAKTTRAPVTITSSTTSTTVTPSTTAQASTTTSNVSQILLDLLTNENHYKELPKIDTLFTVPHVIDNEPWRPITQPYYERTSEPSVAPVEITSDLNAEDRMGVAEVIDDVSILESLLTPIPPVKHRDRTTIRPIGLHNVDPDLAADVYVPSPIYTSFTLPTYAPPLKNMETLGSNYPKPHPIPVDKISGVVEVIDEVDFIDDDDDGKPVERPPKDKQTSVSINVLQADSTDNDTEQLSIDGASILKKHNTTTSTSTTTTSSTAITTNSSPTTTSTTRSTTTTTMASSTPNTTKVPATSTVSITPELEVVKTTYKTTEQPQNEISKENSTRRPNNKVSIIPSTGAPHLTWELVNTSTNENDTFSKNSPEKYYNDTLQAIITKNDDVFPNTTPKFSGKVSIFRNLTEIIKKYTQQNSPTRSEATVNDMEVEERHNHNKMTGSVEVVPDDELEITTAGVITLLPAKSNLGMNRPLRPRPKIRIQETQPTKENVRSFFRNDPETQKIIDDLSTENYYLSHEINQSDSGSAEVIPEIEQHDQLRLSTEPETIQVNAPGNFPTSSRFPKSSDDLNFSNGNNKAFKNLEVSNTTTVPEGTYRVSYHVTGSVSSKRANKTQTLPAYELALEPDVVLEIPINQTNPLTIDKLKQLASLATISDSNNNTLFRAPGGVISTKAIPSSYTLNQAGFKILTKTFNKNPPSKQEGNSFDKPEKSYNKPHVAKPNKEKENVSNFIKELIKEGKLSQYKNDEMFETSKLMSTKQHVSISEKCDNATSFRCPSGLCLPLTSRCNRLLDCPDGDDERSCSCADYLRTDFSQSKICDGVVDCWDYSDENKCGMLKSFPLQILKPSMIKPLIS